MLNIHCDQGRTMMEVKGNILTICAELSCVIHHLYIHHLYNEMDNEKDRVLFKASVEAIVNDYENTWKLDEEPKGVKIDGKAMNAILRKMRGEERG